MDTIENNSVEINYSEMTKEQLIAEIKKMKEALEKLEIGWFNLDAEVRYYADRLFEPCLAIRRDYKSFYGKYLGATFELKEHIIMLDHEYTDYENKERIKEVRLARLPKGAMLSIEFIQDKTVTPMPREQLTY